MRYSSRIVLVLLGLAVSSANIWGAEGNPLAGPDEKNLAKTPEASLHAFHTRQGFEVELMAAEPLVQDPIAFAWGPDGKLWVVEMGDYPLGVDGHGKPGGRIKYLEDTDGDGKYDKATLFLDGLSFPTGVMPWRRGVLVTCAPEIFYAEDTDGDGKADLRVPLFTGFKEGNPQHRLNGLVYGLDNWVYGPSGDSGHIRSTKTGRVVDLGGRDFRLRPDEGLIEPATGRSQYGRNRDDWGNWFGCHNSNPMWHCVLEDHYLRRNPHFAPSDPCVPVSVTPGASRVYPASRTLPRFNEPGAANHFTSACSAMVYRDELFGPVFSQSTFVSEPVHNLVHREVLSAKGVTFQSRRAPDEQESEFLASSDNWCRPTMIQTGPDGALWVADMYRQVIEHPEWIPKDWQQKLDLRAGWDKGRLYRVYPAGKRPRPIPRLDHLDTSHLVAALDSPSGWQRDMAQQLLVWGQDPKAVPLLEKLAAQSPRPLARLQALCTLDGLNALPPELLKQSLADSHPGVRRHAVRLCESRLTGAPALGAALLHLVTDSDPQVRLQLACSLGAWDDPRAGRALGALALQESDSRFLTGAVLSSVNRQNLEPVVQAVLAGSRRPPTPLLVDLLRQATALSDTRALAALLDEVGRPEQGRYAPWQFEALAGWLDALDQANTPLSKWKDSKDESLEKALRSLGGLFDAARQKGSGVDPVLAVRLLGRAPDHQAEDVATLANLLVPQTPEELQLAAAAALGKLRTGKVPELLLQGWKGYSPALRAQVLDVLGQRSDGVQAVLEALQGGSILPADVDTVRRQRLLQHPTPAVRERAARLFAGALNPDRQKVIDAYRPALTLAGDRARGLAVFTRTCATCHQLSGVGHPVGPDLGSVGDKSPEGLLTAILDPNREVEPRYLNYLATTRDGRTFTGVLTATTGSSITLVGPDGKEQAILRADLEDFVSTGKSPMPEGLEKDLRPQDLADLITYLRSASSLPGPKGHQEKTAKLLHPAADGSLYLTADAAGISGSTIVLEGKYGNLGYWSSADDRAVWSVEVPRPGRYAVWLDWACADASAGNTFLLETGAARLTGTVSGTGDWDTYRQARVGEISLLAGRQTFTMRANGKLAGALLDLKSIRLVPIADK